MKDASWLPRRQKNAKLFPFFAGKLFDHSRLGKILAHTKLFDAWFKVYSFRVEPRPHFSLASRQDCVPLATEIFCFQPENDDHLLSINKTI